jgi:hypothetical protein
MSFKGTLTQIKDTAMDIKGSIEQSFEENKRQGKIKLDICKQCEHFNDKLKLCGQCGCFMPAKTRLPDQHCPINKW